MRRRSERKRVNPAKGQRDPTQERNAYDQIALNVRAPGLHCGGRALGNKKRRATHLAPRQIGAMLGTDQGKPGRTHERPPLHAIPTVSPMGTGLLKRKNKPEVTGAGLRFAAPHRQDATTGLRCQDHSLPNFCSPSAVTTNETPDPCCRGRALGVIRAAADDPPARWDQARNGLAMPSTVPMSSASSKASVICSAE